MVDVGEKPITKRAAAARGRIKARPETIIRIKENSIKKGDVFAVARIAGIMAAKRADEIIPLCHAVPLSGVEIDFTAGEDFIEITASARCSFRTGVEMEALTAVSVAALTIYDMCKAIDRGMEIEDIRLTAKSGGRSGTYKRQEEPDDDR